MSIFRYIPTFFYGFLIIATFFVSSNIQMTKAGSVSLGTPHAYALEPVAVFPCYSSDTNVNGCGSQIYPCTNNSWNNSGCPPVTPCPINYSSANYGYSMPINNCPPVTPCPINYSSANYGYSMPVNNCPPVTPCPITQFPIDYSYGQNFNATSYNYCTQNNVTIQSVSPTSVTVGKTITIYGSNFDQNQNEVTIHQQNGNYGTTLTVPSYKNGTRISFTVPNTLQADSDLQVGESSYYTPVYENNSNTINTPSGTYTIEVRNLVNYSDAYSPTPITIRNKTIRPITYPWYNNCYTNNCTISY